MYFLLSSRLHKKTIFFFFKWRSTWSSLRSKSYPSSCSGHTSRWHTQLLNCAEDTLSSLRPTWQRLELCWHLSFLSGLILWLCSHGVRGKAGVTMVTPVDGALGDEQRREGGVAASHQHHIPPSLSPSPSPLQTQLLSCLHAISTSVTFSVAAANGVYLLPRK